MPAKAVFIFVCPFVSLAQDCAASFTPRQLQKGDGLRKNGRLRDLFGVAKEALSGPELLQTLLCVSRSRASSLICRLEHVLHRSAIAYDNAVTWKTCDPRVDLMVGEPTSAPFSQIFRVITKSS
jgi:hypothetical protein